MITRFLQRFGLLPESEARRIGRRARRLGLEFFAVEDASERRSRELEARGMRRYPAQWDKSVYTIRLTPAVKGEVAGMLEFLAHARNLGFKPEAKEPLRRGEEWCSLQRIYDLCAEGFVSGETRNEVLEWLTGDFAPSGAKSLLREDMVAIGHLYPNVEAQLWFALQ